MAQVESENVLCGPKPYEEILDISLGQYIFETYRQVPGDNIFMIDASTNEHLKYEELLQKTCNLATFLIKNGYGKQSIVTVCSENNLQFFIPLIACFYIGATVAPINHNYTNNELHHCLNISQPEIIFCSEKVLNIFLNLQKQIGFIRTIVVIDSDKKHQGVFNLNELVKENVEINSFKPYNCKKNGDLMALILSSSGTTGLPKGVMISHRNIMAKVMQICRDPIYKDLNTGDYTLMIMPFFHAYGLLVTIFYSLTKNTVVTMKRFDEDMYLKAIHDYKISMLVLAPPLAIFLSKSPKVQKYDLSSVMKVKCGAAPLSKTVQEQLKTVLNVNHIKNSYGLTETTLGVTQFGSNEFKLGSCGKLVSYMMGKVIDTETGKTLKVNQTGELFFKGPLLMMGYYGNHQATKEAFTSDGWLKTGDIGYYDEEGCFYIVDRLKELIKYKGYQVAPAELEALLINYPGVIDAGVVGKPDEVAGELPLAFIVKNPKVLITEKELQEYVANHVSSQKRLRGGIIFCSEIPKNPSGKILRRELRKLLLTQKSKL